ncbi:MAG: nitrate/nitrite transporter NrtS [Deltaproteobacteria bacterium]|nr:nitrate/nitrite transporter NrtS [Deltaproteobacteria bacterium]
MCTRLVGNRAVQTKGWRLFFSSFFHPRTVARSIKVALVVGPVLATINHLDSVLSQGLTSALMIKIGLTFLVPFSVSGFSSAQTMMAACHSTEELRDGACKYPER